MSYSKIPGGMWAVTIALALFWPSSLRQSPVQDDPSKKTQQDQDKQKKKDKTSTDSNQPANNSKTDDTKNGDKPTPLFGGSLNIKSSRQTKDSATLGFNGVDDNGQVQKSFLSANATGADAAAVQKMSSNSVKIAELEEFIQQGGLNPAPAPQKASNPGGKP